MAEAVVKLPPAMAASAASPQAVAIDAEMLGQLLAALASRQGPLPKYRYPSAGTLYPVQTYLVLRRQMGALEPGSYYYDPQAHALALLSPEQPAAPDATRPELLLVLVAEAAAIEPIYHGESEPFCLLEAGYMTEALRQAAPDIALRDAGDPAVLESAMLARAFRLGPTHRPLAALAVETGRR